MGSFSELVIAEYPIFISKNSYHEDIVKLLFHSDDFKTEIRSYSNRNVLIWGDTFHNNTDDYIFKGFRQTVKVCLQRIEIFGVNKKMAKKDFHQCLRKAKKDFVYSFPLSKLKYEDYLDEIKDIILKKKKLR